MRLQSNSSISIINWRNKMIPGIENFYQQIADSIDEKIPDDWSLAKIYEMGL
jgi:hypothetical protein